jgi:uncharacterized membrane protein
VGHYDTADGVRHGFLLRDGAYTTIDRPEAAALEPRRINSRGDIVGVFSDVDGGPHGFLLSGGQFTRLDSPRSSSNFGNGINDAGDVIGMQDGQGYLLRDGKYRRVPRGGVGGIEYRMWDVQDNGRVLVGTAIGGSAITGFISRRHGEVEVITFPDVPDCTAIRGINERGDMAGSFATGECFPPFGDGRGFLLRDGAFTLIHFPGAHGTDAWDVNDDGVIVGRYLDRAGIVHGFKAKPSN